MSKSRPNLMSFAQTLNKNNQMMVELIKSGQMASEQDKINLLDFDVTLTPSDMKELMISQNKKNLTTEFCTLEYLQKIEAAESQSMQNKLELERALEIIEEYKKSDQELNLQLELL